MGFRDLLKKDKGEAQPPSFAPSQAQQQQQQQQQQSAPPEFTFLRSDTYSQEVIHPPGRSGGGAGGLADYYEEEENEDDNRRRSGESSRPRRSFDVFKRSSHSRSPSTSSRAGGRDNNNSNVVSETNAGSEERRAKEHHRLSHRLHLSRAPESSEYVPADLPEIASPSQRVPNVGDSDPGRKTAEPAPDESQWEKRATLLALGNSRPGTPNPEGVDGSGPSNSDQLRVGRPSDQGPGSRNRSSSVVSSKETDADIQEAIRLHEAGQLQESTRLFGILADPKGCNNPLSQVLYGLALRHGWGCEPDPTAAVRYLSAAASNAATVESLALQAGLRKGGAAKGELVLAIFELANCFRNGWGIEKDAYAAKQYYETAANLGDTDAMNEVAWCYLEGFGCKKDKFTAARYYRLAEKNGNKTLGNSWIWKEKYDPDKQKKKK